MFIEIARNTILFLSVLMLFGGIVGFVKAKSKPSLIAGVISALVLAGCYALSSTDLRTSLVVSFVVALILDAVFVLRAVKTKKLMPAVPLLFFLVLGQVIFLLALQELWKGVNTTG